MANLTFKTNLVPASSNGYALGSSTQTWQIYGNLNGTASNAIHSNCAVFAAESSSAIYASTALFAISSGSAGYASESGQISGKLTIGLKNFDGSNDVTIDNLDITTALGYTPYNSTNPNGYTNNIGTITGIKMNGSSKGSSGIVDLGTVITDVSGKLDKSGGTMTGALTLNSNPTSNLHAATKWYVDNAVSFTRSLSSGTTIGTLTINGTGTDLYCETNTNTTYEFYNGTNGFTVTPSGGTATTVTVTPLIENNITGSGTSGYLARFNETNTITNGPQLGNSTTTFLRNDGTWVTPPVTEVAGKTGAVALGTLTIGNKIYNGSLNTTIEIADLGLASTTTFLGITSTNLSDGSTTNPITITIGPTTGSVTATNGSVVMEQDSGEEFIWTGNKWNLMGLASSWALANHIHGNILNNGTITSAGVALAANDRLLFSDNSNSGKIERSSITFDGSTTSKFLSQKGTWEAVPDASTSQKGIVQLVNSVSSTATNMAPTANAVKTTYDAIAGKVNKSGDTMIGPLTVNVLKGTNGIDYGGVLPATATEGQIFFQTSMPYYELPGGGLTGQFLVKNSNDDRDVKWQSLNTNSVSKLGDTMEGVLVAQNNTNYTTKQVRNIIISTEAPSGGSNGDIWIQYVN